MPSSKTIIEELKEELFGCVCNDGRYSQHCERCDEAIRSSMQSLLLHVMGEMPGKRTILDATMTPYERAYEVGRWDAIDEYNRIIQSTIDSIKE